MSQPIPHHLPRFNFGRRLEPAGDRVLHGAGQDPGVGVRYDPGPFRAYYEAAQPYPPCLYMSYVPLKADMPAYFRGLRHALDAYRPHCPLPQIGLYFDGNATDGVAEPPYDQVVADGQFDTQIAAFCSGLRDLGTAAFVRIGFEFNGPWNGYRPESFKAAWVRIVAAMREHQLDDVAAVWCYCPLPSSREEAGRTDRDYQAYYPGDAWVDWWSLDLFHPEMFDLDNTRWFLDDAYAAGFPVMIGESTPRGIGVTDRAAWERWFAPYFHFIRTEPVVKAFCYINWDWDAYPEFRRWRDARIATNPDLLMRYRRELADPLFVHRDA